MSKIEGLLPKLYINQDLMDLYESVDEFASQLLASDFLKGSKLENKPITTSGIEYAHGLGKKYTGFFVLNRNSTAIIYTQPSKDDSRFIKLRSSANVTSTIWVF